MKKQKKPLSKGTIVSTGLFCERECGRMLFTNELDLGECKDCVKYDTRGLPRCNGCGQGLYIDESIKEQMCRECKGGNKSSPVGNPGYTSSIGSMCSHDGMPAICKFGTGTLYATGNRDDWDMSKLDLVISLTGQTLSQTVVLNKQAQSLLPLETYPNMQASLKAHVSINWKDGGAPPVNLNFFSDVIDFIQTGKNVLVHCEGGHGRTGTFVTVLLHLAKHEPSKQDRIAWLRKTYCKKAVETADQMEYLKKLGVKTKMKGSWDFPAIGKTVTGKGVIPGPTKGNEINKAYGDWHHGWM